jgi:hypothetical protein
MRVENYFNGVDNINKSTLNYIINLKIHKYSDIFDNLDDSPLKLRSINKNIQLYLKDSFANIPSKNSTGISFHITGEKKNKVMEESIMHALQRCCLRRLKCKRSELKSSNIDTVIYVLTSVLLLSVGFDLETIFIKKSVLLSTVLEGVNIGGWIFLWEAISMLLFKSKDINSEIQEIHRILSSNVSFTYEFITGKH